MSSVIPQKKFTRKAVGAFHKMGLEPQLLKGIQACRYRLPTPIQRKCIPIALDGHDLVAMARTGSGKTAAFLIPIIHHLKQHRTTVGARCVILAPTRELAIQTQKFAEKLSKSTTIRICVIVGGEAVEQQFDALSRNPDIIIATPGRLCYLLKETGFSLKSVRHCVFDEADRLFEMGFAVQMRIIMNRMSNQKQAMLFSATLPSTLVDFTRACLRNPVMIRLDTDIKVSENLQLSYLFARPDEKLAQLLFLLTNVIPSDKLTLIFAATRHHVELIVALLKHNRIDCVACYGTMEQSYRTANVTRFRKQQVNFMVVTDVAARGIDIPLLDYVVNFHMPTSPKTFVHRVGRVARAGRTGCAWSMVAPDERAYVADISRFLSHKLPLNPSDESDSDADIDSRTHTDTAMDEDLPTESSAGHSALLDGTPSAPKVDIVIEDDSTDDESADYDSDRVESSTVIDSSLYVTRLRDEDSDDEMGAPHRPQPTKQSRANVEEDHSSVAELLGVKESDLSQETKYQYALNDKVSFGIIPTSKLGPHIESVTDDIRKSLELQKMVETCGKAMILYKRTRHKPTGFGIKKSKKIDPGRIHPIFDGDNLKEETDCHNLLKHLTTFRPHTTVFEMGGAANPNFGMMQRKRTDTDGHIRPQFNTSKSSKKKKKAKKKKAEENRDRSATDVNRFKDEKYFVSSEAKQGSDSFVEQMLMLSQDGHKDELKDFILELDPEERAAVNTKKKLHRYNKNTGKYVTEYMGDRMMRYTQERGESGRTISTGHRFGKLYSQWQIESKRKIGVIGETESRTDQSLNQEHRSSKAMGLRKFRHVKGSATEDARKRAKKRLKDLRKELKSKDEIKNQRMTKMKKDRFRKWWAANKDQVKKRKGLRRARPF